ncbi:HIT domain-containing protein [Legionella impletisoli]|uniref:Histidine triad (HIT) protein n=1 Tax=Legionella impletisoli TaxID=343510 RepID=A0A917JR24_9GAMM|nr:HIT domain-containing protein [Legionella impletisoli]GGI82356.1 histidine triad (HIT) protein [Legionella impletisoli]
MTFKVDERIQSTSIELIDWPLSRLFLKDESRFPWFILVPRIDGIEEINQLDKTDHNQLMQEVSQLSCQIQEMFNPFKINVATLGNIVRQLHVHVVGRYEDDPFWPYSIWQPSYSPTPYAPQKLIQVADQIRECLKNTSV